MASIEVIACICCQVHHAVEFLLPVFSPSGRIEISQFPCRINEKFYH